MAENWKQKTVNRKLWQGAFEGAGDKVILFNSSENICLDYNLIKYDILGSVAHVKMLERQCILKKHEAKAILSALKTVYRKYEKGEFDLDPSMEDVHTNVEAAVTRISEHGKKMHTARSRNDQVLVDMRMFMRDEILEISNNIGELQSSFALLSKQEGVMVSYTHTRVAQPITISFWCDASVQSLYRDLDRLMQCFNRINQNPLGACALAGTSWKIDRDYTAGLLGFGSVQENELDTISSRGECETELLSALSILMTKISGLSEELIWLSQKRLVELPDEFCTGSSIMPNKKNPDVLELIRGRAARVYSDLIHVLTVKKALISGYHSDFQETKYAVMSGIKTTKECLAMMAKIVRALKFNQNKITEELEQGFAQATEIADTLTRKGISFREAHGIVGKLVNDCGKKGIYLSEVKPLTPFNGKEWIKLVSLERERLKRKIILDKKHNDKISKMGEAIENSYKKLL